MIYLADANVWLALAAGRHEHHVAAAAWFHGLGANEAILTRVTQMSILRLLTNPQVMKRDVVTVDVAWQVAEELRSDWRVTFSAEPAGLEAFWLHLMREHPAGHRSWTDAYLAAFALGCGACLATFDQSLAKWKQPKVRVLG